MNIYAEHGCDIDSSIQIHLCISVVQIGMQIFNR